MQKMTNPMIAVMLIMALPQAVAISQNSTHRLRSNMLTAALPNFMALIGEKAGPSCQCTFDDQCTCAGALKFMDCVKQACNSGECQCVEKDGTNHFLESCSAMADECTGIGLKCGQEQATCKDSGVAVALHSKVKKHSVGDTDDKVAAEAPVSGTPDPKKYVLHTKYKSTVKAVRSQGHRVFAQGIVVTLIVLSVTVALLSSANSLVAKHTWGVLDFVVVTFLAVAWFIVVIHSLDYFKLVGWWKIGAHCAVSMLFLVLFMFGSWSLRNNEVSGAVFAGIFTPMTMWCNAGFVETVGKYNKDSPLLEFAFLAALVVWYTVVALFFFFVVSKAMKKGWGDDMQAHMAGGALAGGFALWCHLMITGAYHTIEAPRAPPPSLTKVLILNAFSVFLIALAMISLPVLSRKSKSFVDAPVGSSGYWKLRVCGVLTHFMTLLPRFSIIVSLAHLILEHCSWDTGSISAQLVLALTSTVVGVLLIYLCAYVPFLKRDTDIAKQLSDMLVGLGGFMVGVAWSNVLDNSINMMIQGSGYAHPFPIKLGITAFLSAFIFPVYCWYLKPLIMQKGP